MSIGLTKDYKLKVKNLHASHTLGKLDHQQEEAIFVFRGTKAEKFILHFPFYDLIIGYEREAKTGV
jgi:hypothetical protein